MLADHVLFIDNEALIVDKPAGLPVDPPRNGGLSVENHCQALMLGYKAWPKPAHRLDRDTSGCLLLGRSDKSHKRLSRAFEEGQVTKRYLAVIDGVPAATSGTIDMPLGKRSSVEEGWRMVPDPAGKPSRTAWSMLSVADGRALIELLPETGRTHQLRVHAASGIGHAITGDPYYGVAHVGGMMLHAADLSIARGTKPPMSAHAPFPTRFAALGFTDPDAA